MWFGPLGAEVERGNGAGAETVPPVKGHNVSLQRYTQFVLRSGTLMAHETAAAPAVCFSAAAAVSCLRDRLASGASAGSGAE